jgi:uncharacterized protein YkwD
MLKKILLSCIALLLGLGIFFLVWPHQAAQVAKVLGVSITVANKPIENVSAVSDDPSAPFSVENIIDATNEQRIKAGLTPLKSNAKLEESAKLKVEDMIKNQYFEHTSPTGKTVADLGTEVGYDYIVMGENLALGNFTDANDLLQAWMNSPAHRANILSTSYQDIGVYAAQGTYQGHTVWFAVQHFGTQRDVCPSVSTALKSDIDSLNSTINQEESQISSLRTEIEDPNHVQGQPYTDLINQFNALVVVYNGNITTSQQYISQYNTQVVAFNNCLSQYQVSEPSESGSKE